MGNVDALTAQLRQAGVVGLDTSVFIYAFERHPDYGPLSRAVFRELESGRCQGSASALALGEVLVGAKKADNPELVLRYRDVFQRFPGLTMHYADAAVMEQMADLRVRYGLPTPDAIHIGTALVHGANAFVTNDSGLKRITAPKVLVLSEFV